MQRLLILFILLTLLPFPALSEETAPASYDRLIRDALTSENLVYDYDEEYQCYTVGFTADDRRLGDISVFLYAYDSGILLQAVYEETIPEPSVNEVNRLLTMLNGDLLGLKYYLYFDTFDVSGEVFLPMTESRLGDEDREMLCDWLYCLVDEMDWDTEYLMEIIEHGETAENAFAMYIADYDSKE